MCITRAARLRSYAALSALLIKISPFSLTHLKKWLKYNYDKWATKWRQVDAFLHVIALTFYRSDHDDLVLLDLPLHVARRLIDVPIKYFFMEKCLLIISALRCFCTADNLGQQMFITFVFICLICVIARFVFTSDAFY